MSDAVPVHSFSTIAIATSCKAKSSSLEDVDLEKLNVGRVLRVQEKGMLRSTPTLDSPLVADKAATQK